MEKKSVSSWRQIDDFLSTSCRAYLPPCQRRLMFYRQWMPVPQTHNQPRSYCKKTKKWKVSSALCPGILNSASKTPRGLLSKNKIKLKNIKGARRIAFTSNHCNFTRNSSEGMKVTDFLLDWACQTRVIDNQLPHDFSNLFIKIKTHEFKT